MVVVVETCNQDKYTQAEQTHKFICSTCSGGNLGSNISESPRKSISSFP